MLNRFDGKAHTAGADEVKNMEDSQKFVSPSPFYYPDKYLQLDAPIKSPPGWNSFRLVHDMLLP